MGIYEKEVSSLVSLQGEQGKYLNLIKVPPKNIQRYLEVSTESLA